MQVVGSASLLPSTTHWAIPVRCPSPSRLCSTFGAYRNHINTESKILGFPSRTLTSCRHVCKAGEGQKGAGGGGGGENLIYSSGIFVLWLAGIGYAAFLAPNQTPLRDQYFIEKFLNLTDDGVVLNQVFSALFYIMGIWPMIYSALLIPAGKSRNGIPVWPFVSLSFAFGAFALMPYFALWQPPEDQAKLPLPKAQLQDFKNVIGRAVESKVVPWLLLAGAIYCTANLATAGSAAWTEYSRLLQESRLVHVTSMDFLTLTILAPFWMVNDAQLRSWQGNDKLLPLLCCLPFLGPAIYLCLRPKAE